ncbi:hypothetical protein [Microbacterium sp. NPDC055665]
MVFALLLHWVYADLISPTFSYLGYRYREPTTAAFSVAVVIAIAVALALPRRLDRASSIVLWLLFVVTVAPTILIAPYTTYRTDDQALVLGGAVALIFMGVAWGVRGKVKPRSWAVSPTSIWLILIVISLVTYGLLAFTQGISLRILSFLDVYDVREEYAGNLEGIGVLSYLVFIQANVVNPLMVARGLFKRAPVWTIAGLLGQLILYSTTGFKGMLFAIPAWFIVAFVMRRRKRKPDGLTLVWGAAGLILISAVIDQLLHSILLTSLLSRRFLITPGVFTSVYAEFFSTNPQVHLGHSILRPFVDYPYELTPPYVIGQWMAGLPTMAANANMFADGFANFGWIGMIGAGVVLLAYLRILDQVAVGLPLGVVGIVMTMPTVALSNTSVLTAMLSHGLIAAIVLLAVMPRDYDELSKRQRRAHDRAESAVSPRLYR